MTWFRVDDAFHSHPKVLATPPAALGLWVIAGAWSSANLTEGFVPDNVLPRLLPDAEGLAASLCTSGLWRKRRSGYQFHDWTDFNPTREEALKLRAKNSSGGALGNHRRWHVDKGVHNPNCVFCEPVTSRKEHRPPDRPPDRSTDRSSEGVTESPPNPPDPTRSDTETPPTPPQAGGQNRSRRRREPPDPLNGQQAVAMAQAEANMERLKATLTEPADPEAPQRVAAIRDSLKPHSSA
jgi:FtsZ-interacting cell division protein ZipA